MNEQRGNLYLLTGLVIGLLVGLVYSWWISPINYVDTEPAALAPRYRDVYRQAAAMAYRATGDLGRASERIRLIDGDAAVQSLAAQAQRMLAENQPPDSARALAVLAADLGRGETGSPIVQATVISASETQPSVGSTPQVAPETESAQPANTPTQAEVAAVQTATAVPPTRTPTVTFTPQPTFTPRPTATPARVLGAPFTLSESVEQCGAEFRAGLLQVWVVDASGNPLPGVPVSVAFAGSEETFFTGLAPEIGPGYADFQMQPGIAYRLRVGEVSEPVEGLTMPSCGGGWKMVFAEGKR